MVAVAIIMEASRVLTHLPLLILSPFVATALLLILAGWVCAPGGLNE